MRAVKRKPIAFQLGWGVKNPMYSSIGRHSRHFVDKRRIAIWPWSMPAVNWPSASVSLPVIFYNALIFRRSNARILCFWRRFLIWAYSFSNKSLPMSRKKWKWQIKSGRSLNTVLTAHKIPLPISCTKAMGSPYCCFICCKNGTISSAFSEGSLILSNTIF